MIDWKSVTFREVLKSSTIFQENLRIYCEPKRGPCTTLQWFSSTRDLPGCQSSSRYSAWWRSPHTHYAEWPVLVQPVWPTFPGRPATCTSVSTGLLHPGVDRGLGGKVVLEELEVKDYRPIRPFLCRQVPLAAQSQAVLAFTTQVELNESKSLLVPIQEFLSEVQELLPGVVNKHWQAPTKVSSIRLPCHTPQPWVAFARGLFFTMLYPGLLVLMSWANVESPWILAS